MSLPRREESVPSPVVEDRPRSDAAVSPVPVVPELPEAEPPVPLPEEEAALPEEVEMLPAEIVGMEGMDGPEISGMVMLLMPCAESRTGALHSSITTRAM